MLRTCSAKGCTTFTLGEFCLDHEAPPMAEHLGKQLKERRPKSKHDRTVAPAAEGADTGGSDSQIRLTP
jgi:hypothetical protein